MVTNIFFDLDGVLVDAVKLHQKSFVEAIRLYGIDMTEEEHMEMFNGRTTRDKIKMLVMQNRLNESDTDKIFEYKQAITNELIKTTIMPIQNVIDTVRWAYGMYNISLCSNSIRSTVLSLLKQSEIDKYFKNKHIISNEDINKPKPDPSGYIRLLQLNCCHPSECVVVEDNNLGVMAAKNAKIKNIHIISSPYCLDLIKLKEFINDCNIANGGARTAI